MKQVKVRAPAKINLYLDILDKRENGYHNLNMIMQSVGICDNLLITKTKSKKIILSSNNTNMPLDNTNIIYKAVEVFYKYAKVDFTGLEIFVQKIIPMGAGLGGGSADAAACLIGLDFLEKTRFSTEILTLLGLKIGADVPFMFNGGTAIVNGIGEKITALNPISDCFILIAKPNISINTKKAYEDYDKSKKSSNKNFNYIIKKIKENNDLSFAFDMYNAFMKVISIEDVDSLIDIMNDNGALNAMMTGSGSAVFGIFKNYSKAYKAMLQCQEITKEIFITNNIHNGVHII